MNRRQKKKAYKKKYGHNPPKKYQEDWEGIIVRAMGEVTGAMGKMLSALKATIDAMAKMAAELVENIIDMPEAEFNKLLENSDLDEKSKEQVRQIRRTLNEYNTRRNRQSI